jgi:CheY-like chemotaxis protein
MTKLFEAPGFLALIDDDEHSVRLMSRTLKAEGAGEIVWLGDAEQGRERLEALVALGQPLPGLVIVDLKAHSGATAAFIRATAALRADADLVMVAMAPTADREAREPCLAAGAAAVFVRHAERDAYRREASNIVSFWARSRSPHAIGM